MGWTLLFKVRDGHRYFRNQHGRIACADNSGVDPDRTDDGALFIDINRPLSVYRSEGGTVMVRVPLISHGTEVATADPIEGLPELVKLWGGPHQVEVAATVKSMFEALKVVLS